MLFTNYTSKYVLKFILICVLFSFTVSYAQFNYWFRTYGGEDDERSSCLFKSIDDDFVFVGTTKSFGANYLDTWIVKTDQFGDTTWTKRYGDSGINFASCIVEQTESIYLILGMDIPDFGSPSKLSILQIDDKGNFIRKNLISLDNSIEGRWGTKTFKDEIVICGDIYSPTTFERDIFLSKLDSQADTLWLKTFDFKANESVVYLEQTPDSGFLAVCDYKKPFSDDKDILLVKFNSLGDTIWSKIYGGNDVDVVNNFVQTIDGGFLFAGWTYSYSEYPGCDYWLLRTNSTGDSLWMKTYDRETYDLGISITRNIGSGYYLIGNSESSSNNKDLWMINLDSKGDSLWSRTIKGYSNSWPAHMISLNDSGYLITGYTNSEDNFKTDAYLLKVDTLGQTVTLVKSNFENNSSISKYNLNCYPNPFNYNTTVSFELSERTYVKLSVFNILGQQVDNLLQDTKAPGSYKLTWDARLYSSGIYFISFITDNYQRKIKTLLIK